VHGSNARNLCIAVLISTSKNAVFLIIAYVFSSRKLEKRAEQVLPGSKGGWGEEEGWQQGGEMPQTVYAHMNN
jgi:hypothetical protein